MSRRQEFDSAMISAKDIQPGDRLDAAGKVRIHAARMIGENMVVAHRLRGSKAPGTTSYYPDKQVRVWRAR